MPYHHFTPSERSVLASMHRAGYTQAETARALGRSQSTISRELRRNGERNGYYNPHTGNVLYWMRRQRVYRRWKREDPQVMAYVRFRLAQRWSPEQIAGRIRHHAFAHDRSMWISHETIYRYIWEDKRQGGTLYRYLRRGRKKYGKRGAGRHPNASIKGRVSIEERPEVVARRERCGDWEGDTFYGRHRKGCLVTVVERKTGLLLAGPMANGKAHTLNRAMTDCFRAIPNTLIHTITVDNGKEFARFKDLEDALDTRVYFAHPYSAWERALNENTNGLLRRYFPRTTDLRTITPEQLQTVVDALNNRPRKRLHYRTPREAFDTNPLALDR